MAVSATSRRTTKRERLVLSIRREHGLKLREVAAQMGFASIGGMLHVLRTRRPHAATLAMVRDFARRHGRRCSIEDLVG